MSLLSEGQSSARFPIKVGTPVERLRAAADLLEGLADDEYVASVEGVSNVTRVFYADGGARITFDLEVVVGRC